MSTDRSGWVTARVRDNVGTVAALLSALSVGLVFAAAGGVVPARTIPRSPTLVAVVPHVNAVISAVAIVAIVAGVGAIRRGDVGTHRRRMLGAFALFVVFLVLYFYKVVLAGPATFGGPDAVYAFVYLPVLVVHVSLAVLCLPLLYYVLLLAATHDPAELPTTNHPRVGRVAAALWLVSFALGIVVYLLLYVVYP